MTAHWSDTADEVIRGDHVTMLVYVTPAKGTVLLPVSNFALRDREAGTVSSVNTSVGAWKKLDRIRRNPRVALAFHTREHSTTNRGEYVLVQGTASLPDPIPDYPDSIIDNWERIDDWRNLNGLWRRWLRVFALRVPIDLSVERVVVWPDLACGGRPEVHGAPLPSDPPPSQNPPKNGTAPRIDHRRAAARAGRLPHVLLGWVGADGFPLAVPATVAGVEEDGIVLDVPEGVVPAGGRRAGLTAHWFSHRVIGQNQRKHTGWLEADAGARRVLYSPHTKSNYRFPASRRLFLVVAGAGTRYGLPGARRAGLVA